MVEEVLDSSYFAKMLKAVKLIRQAGRNGDASFQPSIPLGFVTAIV